MPPKKTTTLNLRVDPCIKEAVRIAASLEHRSIANLIEVLIRQHCQEAGISFRNNKVYLKIQTNEKSTHRLNK